MTTTGTDELTMRRGLIDKGFSEFLSAHGKDLSAAKLRYKFDSGVAAPAKAIVDASETLLAELAGLEKQAKNYKSDYLATLKTAARDKATATWKDGLTRFDSGLFDLVRNLAQAAYPKLPAGADENALWTEAESILEASTNPPFTRLMNLARAERRDLAAMALSERASSWAGTHGLTRRDLQRVRELAIEGAQTLGTPAEQAAARAYKPAKKLLGYRGTVVGVMQAAAKVATQDPRDLGFTPESPELSAWSDGPDDAPPIVKV